jgi:hypothetical protein
MDQSTSARTLWKASKGNRPPHQHLDDRISVCLAGSGHAADIARQSAHLIGVTQAVAEEGKVNRELAGLLVERLEASKRCAAGLDSAVKYCWCSIAQFSRVQRSAAQYST